MPKDIKSVLTNYHVRRSMDHLEPSAILADAARLLPGSPALYLWSFEAAMANADFPAATRAIRAARQVGAAKVPVLLARARLLEARRREPRAHRLIAASVKQRRGDERLVSALHVLAG